MEKIVDKSKDVKSDVNSTEIKADYQKIEKKKLSDLLDEFSSKEMQNSIVVNDEETMVKRFSD